MNGKEKPREDVEGLVKGWQAEAKEVGGSVDGVDEEEEGEDSGVIVGADEDEDEEDVEMEEVVPLRKSTRSKSKGKAKK